MNHITTERKTNRLIYETSPYLLQHAHNPVDWYPWGQEAFEIAKAENKPIFLSVGYSACHWCHVMEKESFENCEIADLMNASFVSIKVDREERPDLDHIYQTSCQLITGQGGWPLSVFLTPDLRPFFAGTYYPPNDKYGRPGFKRLLETLRDVYRDDPAGIAKTASDLVAAITVSDNVETLGSDEAPRRDLVLKGVRFLYRHFDRINGGFGKAPKFPNTPNLQLFLQQHGDPDGEQYVQAALAALQKMAAGGMYDHLGGGFHRYSTDAHWLVPHFEKMLYDNALLPPLYLAAFQITKDSVYAQVTRQTLDFVLREMTEPRGGFYSTIDADSEGEEGKFYVWCLEQVEKALSATDTELFAARYGVTDKGNFEHGSSVLHLAQSVEDIANKYATTPETVMASLQTARERLLAVRSERVPPIRDEKVLSGWNGLMVSALAKAGVTLGESRYISAAENALGFIEHEMRMPDGRLLHGWKEHPSRQPGFLEDYAFVSQGLLDTYTATFNHTYLEQAQELMRVCLDRFWDTRHGGFFLAEEANDLIHRPKSAHDQSIPSGNGVAAHVLLRLHSYAPDEGFLARVEALFVTFRHELERNPWGTATLLGALDLHGAGLTDLVFVGSALPRWDNSLLEVARSMFLPNVAIYAISDKEPVVPPPCNGKKAVDGTTTAYICRNFTCSAPVTNAVKLQEELSTTWQPVT